MCSRCLRKRAVGLRRTGRWLSRSGSATNNERPQWLLVAATALLSSATSKRHLVWPGQLPRNPRAASALSGLAYGERIGSGCAAKHMGSDSHIRHRIEPI